MTNEQITNMLTRKHGPFTSESKERFNCTIEQAVESEGIRFSWLEKQVQPYDGYSEAAIKAGIQYIRERYGNDYDLHK